MAVIYFKDTLECRECKNFIFRGEESEATFYCVACGYKDEWLHYINATSFRITKLGSLAKVLYE